MKESGQSQVYGQTAPASKMTWAVPALVATVVAVPVFVLLSVIEWLWL
ncbi:hypothetical protein [Shimia sp. Alg240-R146]|nr:hypothetical protein [Shimia sp. Alg240-R146]